MLKQNMDRKRRSKLWSVAGIGIPLTLMLIAGAIAVVPRLLPAHAASATTPVALTATYTLNSQWDTGFNVTLVVNNTSQTDVKAWTLQFAFGGDQTIPQNAGWGGVFSQTGNQVTITNDDDNGSIDAGESATLGFNGTWTHNNTSPTTLIAMGTPANMVTNVTGTNGTLSATYKLNSEWDTGINVTLVINNNSQTDINGWTLQFAFGGDQVIPQNAGWGGVFSQTGQQVKITNDDDNGAIDAGESVTLGFNAVWSKDDTSPATLIVSGTPA